MNKKFGIMLLILLVLSAALLIFFWLKNGNIALFNPKGAIAEQERDLMRTALLLMLVVVIPVFILTAAIAWKYRAGNTKAKYSPNLDHNTIVTFAWWGILIAIISILAVITWQSTHALDPYKPLLRQGSGGQALTIQVVALNWKWLFIYPEQNIASVNFVEFPVGTPINFELTADAPMNSFWIPQLGGQMYAMAGMKTRLHLIADSAGEFAGSSAEINGKGFAGMKFTAKATSQSDFDAWVQSVKGSSNTLNTAEYNKLVTPSENNPAVFYSSAEKDLYNSIIMKFMPARHAPASQDSLSGRSQGDAGGMPSSTMPGMDMSGINQ